MPDGHTTPHSVAKAEQCKWCPNKVYRDGLCLECHIHREPPPSGFYDWREHDSWADYRMGR